MLGNGELILIFTALLFLFGLNPVKKILVDVKSLKHEWEKNDVSNVGKTHK